jgi:hypothetical protein
MSFPLEGNFVLDSILYAACSRMPRIDSSLDFEIQRRGAEKHRDGVGSNLPEEKSYLHSRASLGRTGRRFDLAEPDALA